MTEGVSVAQLDFTKPPPGYEPHPFPAGMTVLETQQMGEAEALAAVWAHFKTHNGPPGMVVQWFRNRIGIGNGEWTVSDAKRLVWTRRYDCRDEGRGEARAWAWHDRRHALADRINTAILESVQVDSDVPIWPRCLTWTDEQITEVEYWLADSTAEMPEVLCA